MRLFQQSKIKKIETKPVSHLSYYFHGSANRPKLPVNLFFRKIKSELNIILIFLLIGLFITALYFFLNRYNFTEITDIQVNGANKYVNTNEVYKYSSNNLNKHSILVFKSDVYAKTLETTFLGAQSFAVKAVWPNKIIIDIIEREPIALINSNNERFFMDKNGYILAKSPDSAVKLPEINYKDTVVVGTFIRENIVPESVKLIEQARSSNLVVNKMQFDSQYITLNINDNIELDLSLVKDNSLAMKQVSAIMEKSLSEGQKLRKVDLRFSKVIVLYD